jgi:hypothetical protein
MTHWTASPTESHQSVSQALAVVDNLLSYVKETQGKPSRQERALFAAAVVFTYGIWENYVEQLAIEIAEKLSVELAPEKVPEQIKKALEKRTAWELTVAPGWRALWLDRVKVLAVGDTEEKYGMNTARAGQVENLLVQAGVNQPFEGIPITILPDHLSSKDRTIVGAIDELVKLRGEIVHTGKVPPSLRKAHVKSWKGFVAGAADNLDEICRRKCKTLMN